MDTSDGAAVRIAMTVATAEPQPGRQLEVSNERPDENGEVAVDVYERRGLIHADLRSGPDIARAQPLRSNTAISFMGMIPLGEGFWIGPETAANLSAGVERAIGPHIRAYRNGKDILYTPRGILALDFFGMTEMQLREQFPAAYQWLLERVKPVRAKDKRKSYRENWWIFAEPHPAMRHALLHMRRYIGTTETAKHRTFMFLDGNILPDQKIRVIATDDAAILGVLSSVAHTTWALAAGARLGVGNDPVYNNSRCFDPFPFPVATDTQQARIRDLAEQLDAHRKRQEAAHPDLTLTGMYNVLEKLRAGETLTAKERTIHEHGLVSVLRQLHDELDAAVLEAYGWSDLLHDLAWAQGNLSGHDEADPEEQSDRQDIKRQLDEAILQRLVALNVERAAEEARGTVRWLRPAFQHPQPEAAPAQAEIDAGAQAPAGRAAHIHVKPQAWPADAIAQVRAVADALTASATPLSVDAITARFKARGPWKKRVPALLDMLVALGRAQERDGRYRAMP